VRPELAAKHVPAYLKKQKRLRKTQKPVRNFRNSENHKFAIFFFGFSIHTACAPIAAGSHADGGAVIRKPGSAWLEGTAAIHVTCLYVSWYVCVVDTHSI